MTLGINVTGKDTRRNARRVSRELAVTRPSHPSVSSAPAPRRFAADHAGHATLRDPNTGFRLDITNSSFSRSLSVPKQQSAKCGTTAAAAIDHCRYFHRVLLPLSVHFSIVISMGRFSDPQPGLEIDAVRTLTRRPEREHDLRGLRRSPDRALAYGRTQAGLNAFVLALLQMLVHLVQTLDSCSTRVFLLTRARLNAARLAATATDPIRTDDDVSGLMIASAGGFNMFGSELADVCDKVVRPMADRRKTQRYAVSFRDVRQGSRSRRVIALSKPNSARSSDVLDLEVGLSSWRCPNRLLQACPSRGDGPAVME